jgi:peptidoglycan/LPS O-acetylase OafA/YrhL
MSSISPTATHKLAAAKESGFRQDIQGLRAIAVLAVVVFHINPWALGGGFIGVDMFFVISGYLITGIIWRDLSNGSFSLTDFYVRRIRRLFPALFAMASVCILLAYLVFLPEEIIGFGKSLIASIFYVSNFFFYSQTDYFASDLELSPLLHTWSLSVEEQFYLFFPLLLLFLHRKFTTKVLIILAAIAIVSLVASQALLSSDMSLAFFSSPTRFFQFVAGSIIAIAPNYSGARGFKECLNIIGLLIIVGCLFLIDSKTPFPGINALYPTIATAMIIFAGQTGGLLTSRLLSMWPTQFFGKISYSMYLWHWPLIVFYKIQYTAAPDKIEKVGLLVGSIVLGYLSWRFIENTLRYKAGHTTQLRPIYTSLAFSLLLSAFGFYFATSDGLKSRFSEQQLFLSHYIDYQPEDSREGTCFLSTRYARFDYFDQNVCVKFDATKPNYLLIGDSHAAHFYGAIQTELGNVNLTQVTSSGCRPTIDFSGSDYCTSLMRWAYAELISTHHFDAIIVSGRWASTDLSSLKETIDMLSSYSEKLFILGPIVTYDQALPRLLARSFPNVNDSDLLIKATNYESIKKIDSSFKKMTFSPSARYVSVLDAICPGGNCIKVTPEGIPMQWDYGHLTYEGSLEVIARLVANKQLQ